MIPKRVGIKYCGGCNPSYDRVKRVEGIAAALRPQAFLVSYEASPFELLLIVNGCPKACADRRDIRALCPKALALQDEAAGLEKEILSALGFGNSTKEEDRS